MWQTPPVFRMRRSLFWALSPDFGLTSEKLGKTAGPIGRISKFATPARAGGSYDGTCMIIPKATERRLIRKARKGDGNAVAALITAHQDALYAFMLRMTGRPDVAEDVVQEAFVRVLKNLDRFDERFRFSTWLFTIAKRLYVNSVQKLSPTFDSDTVGGWQGKGEAPSHDTVRNESLDNIRDVLDQALSQLNEQQREIILLFHQQNWSITEIAEHVDMPEGTVKSHLHRARKRMRQWINADEALTGLVEDAWA